MRLQEGEILVGRYRLVKLLGEGGMGAVWEALHLVTQKSVALKFLKAKGDVALRQRFYREARAASAVQHKNVVAIHDVVELDDGLFMVMDRLHGETLESMLEYGKLPLQRTCQILGAVVDAVRAAHAAGIVHRDLKPANVFLAKVDGHEEVRVLDFGIAKILGAETAVEGKLTTTGAVMGTPFYMAPEQMWGEPVDARADVWALGVVLYECLAGRRPIDGENIGQLLKAIANQSIVPLGEIDPRLPATLVELVAQMLQTDRTQRLSDLGRVATELAKHAGDNTHITVSTRPADGARTSLVNPLALTQESQPPAGAATGDALTLTRNAGAVSAELARPRGTLRNVLVTGAAALVVGVVAWRVQVSRAVVTTSTVPPAPSSASAAPPPQAPPSASAAPLPASAAPPVASVEPMDAGAPLVAAKRTPPRPAPAASSAPPVATAPPAPGATGVGGLHTAAPF